MTEVGRSSSEEGGSEVPKIDPSPDLLTEYPTLRKVVSEITADPKLRVTVRSLSVPDLCYEVLLRLAEPCRTVALALAVGVLTGEPAYNTVNITVNRNPKRFRKVGRGVYVAIPKPPDVFDKESALSIPQPLSPMGSEGEVQTRRSLSVENLVWDWLNCGKTSGLESKYHVTRKTISKKVAELAMRAKSPEEIAMEFKPRWSRLCYIDATVILVRVELPPREGLHATKRPRTRYVRKAMIKIKDGKGDFVNYKVISNENSYEEIKLFLEETRDKIGYLPEFVISDGNRVIERAIREVFRAVVGICLVHVRRRISEKVQTYDYRAGPPEDLDKRSLFLSLADRAMAARTVAEFDRRMGGLIDEIWTKPFFQTEWARRGFKVLLRASYRIRTLIRYEEKHPDLEIPHTTNSIENSFSLDTERLDESGGIKSEKLEQAKIYLVVGHRRFTPYSSAAKRENRGRAPIELAGVSLTGMPWHTCLLKPKEGVDQGPEAPKPGDS
jgi:hypothetical protein